MSAKLFRVTNFRKDTSARIEQANEILSEYDQKLTIRQLYYQFVSRLIIPNNKREYQNLASLITDARYAGLVDWDAIEDRVREADVPGEWDRIDDIVDAAVEQWRSPRWRNQPKYVELWVEKDALAGVLSPIARRNHVPLSVNRGYSSASAMKVAADRMLEAVGATDVEVMCDNCDAPAEDRNGSGKCNNCETKTNIVARALDRFGGNEFEKQVVVLYLGDHDPSGEDMVRDIRDRLLEFGVPNLSVQKIALTMEQVRRFNPPPNPAKLTDSRAQAYIEKYGDESWELDALPPRELNRLVEQAIARNVDREMMDAVIARENIERERVRAAIERSREG